METSSQSVLVGVEGRALYAIEVWFFQQIPWESIQALTRGCHIIRYFWCLFYFFKKCPSDSETHGCQFDDELAISSSHVSACIILINYKGEKKVMEKPDGPNLNQMI